MVAVFPMNEQFVTVGLLPVLYIPPPHAGLKGLLDMALFPMNEQPITVELLFSPLYIPPPLVPALFCTNVQLVTVGLLAEPLKIPPPRDP